MEHLLLDYLKLTVSDNIHFLYILLPFLQIVADTHLPSLREPTSQQSSPSTY